MSINIAACSCCSDKHRLEKGEPVRGSKRKVNVDGVGVSNELMMFCKCGQGWVVRVGGKCGARRAVFMKAWELVKGGEA